MSPRSDAFVWGIEVSLDGAPFEPGDLKRFVWRDRINEPPRGEITLILDSRRDEPPLKAEAAIGKMCEVKLTPPACRSGTRSANR